MAISNKYNIENGQVKSEVQAVQQAQSTTTTESTQKTGKTSEPVKIVSDNKVDEEALKNNEIVNFMNSDDFKAMSEEEQLKYFKEHYCTGLTDEQTSTLFNNARAMAKEAAQITALSDGTKTDTTADKEGKQTTAVQQQTEQTILQELQTVQKIPSRKDVYNYLLGKEANGTEMTDAEKSVLKTYKSLAAIGHPDFNEGNAVANTQPTTNSKVLEEFNRLVNNANLTPQEKVTEYMKLYLEKNDPEYKNLSKEEQTKRCNEEVKNLVKIVSSLDGSSKTVLSEDDTLLAYSATALLTDLAEKGEKVSDLPTDKTELNNRVDKAFTKQLRAIVKTLENDDNFKDKSNTKQFIEIGNLIYKGDPEYQKKSDDEKLSFLVGELSKKIPELSGLKAIDPELVADIGVAVMKYVADQGENYTFQSLMAEFKNDTQGLLDKLASTKKYGLGEKSVGIMMNYSELLDNVKKRYNKTDAESMLKYLNEKNVNELNDTEKFIKNQLTEVTELRKLLIKRGVDDKDLAKIMDDPQKLAKMLKIRAQKKDWEAKNPGKSYFESDEFNKWYNEEIEKFRANPDNDDAINELSAQLGALLGTSNNEQEVNILNAKIERDLPESAQLVIKRLGFTGAMADDNGEIAAHITNNADKITREAGDILAKNLSEYQRGEYGTVKWNSKFSDEFNETINNNWLKEDVDSAFNYAVSNQKISDDTAKYVSQSLIETASPERQKYYAEQFSKLNNAAVTEGLAAAYNSVDDSVKASYKQALDNAIASGNYTAEQKASFTKAMESGTVSTSSAAKSAESSEATTKATAAASTQASQSSQAAQTAALQSEIKAAQAELSKLQTNETTQSTASSYGMTTSSTSKAASASSTSASEAKKAQAMDNAATTASNIDKSVKDWEKQHDTKLSEDQIKSLKTAVSAAVVEELLNDPQKTESSTEVINTLVSNATSVSDLYAKLVDLYGTKVQDKFIEVLAQNGSSSQISSFAQNTTNSDVIRDLFLKCDSSVLKSELLNMLPPTSVAEMLRNGQIKDYSMVDYKVLSEYITASISSMSNTEFNNYLKFLPLDERNRLCQLRLKTNPSSAVDTTITGEFAQTIKNDKKTAQTALNSSASTGGDAVKSPFSLRTNQTRSETDALTGVVRGSDDWQRIISERQSGIKVPPTERYDTAATLDEDFWDIGSNGSTKVKFRGDYDKQQHKGALYWG